MIMLVPDDIADLPDRGEAADLGRGFEQGDIRTGIGQTHGQRHTEKPRTDNCYILFHIKR